MQRFERINIFEQKIWKCFYCGSVQFKNKCYWISFVHYIGVVPIFVPTSVMQ